MIYAIDQTKDYSHKELYQYLSGVDLPGYVKQASLDEVNDSIVKTACADNQIGLYPVNTKAATYISNAFFVNKIESIRALKGNSYLNKVACAISDAVELWGIMDDVKAYNKIAFDRMYDEYVDNSVTIKIASDELELFTIKTASDLAREAHNFVTGLQRFPFEWRREIATQFVKAAEALGVEDLPELVLKYAGQYYPDVVSVKNEISRRMTKLSGENKTRYQQLKDDVDNISSKDEFFKLAECLHYTEKTAGLYEKTPMRKLLGDPVDCIFTLHLDKVAEICDVVEMGGEKFASADLAAVPADIYHQSFGFELDPKSAEAREILPTMPKSDVSLFKALSGVKPI